MNKEMRAIFVAVLILLTIIISPSHANAIDATSEALKNSPENIAIAFVSAASRNMYLYENNDLNRYSIDCSNYPLLGNELEKMTADTNVAPIDACKKMSLVNDKVEYYRYVRSSQNFIVKDFKQTYTIENVKKSGNCAVVSMSELLNWQYADYDLPSGALISYEVTLAKHGGTWRVIGVVAADELFDQQYIVGDKKFDLDAEKASFDKAIAIDMAALTDTKETANLEKPTYAKRNGYDISKAVQYARDWALSKNAPPFQYHDGKDCMNFASQCVYAGLGGATNACDTSFMDKDGKNKWYWNDWGAWISCSKFRNYITSSDAKLNTLHCESTGDIPFWYSGELTGSVAHVYGDAGELSHAIFITDSRSPARKDMYFCAHTSNRKNEKVSAYYSTGSIYVITPLSLS